MTLSDAAEFLEVAAALVRMSWNGDLNGWVSAGEVANSLRTGKTAQHMGQQLAMWERRGLVESKREEWGKMWRLCPALRTLLGGRL